MQHGGPTEISFVSIRDKRIPSRLGSTCMRESTLRMVTVFYLGGVNDLYYEE